MTKDKRKMTVKLIESDEVMNYRVIAETIARKINSKGDALS